MGQKLGKSQLISEAEPFANVSRKAVTLIWRVFNDIADGFGISREEMEEICADLKDELNISRLAMIEKASALFSALDTDKNGLIDALEFTSCLAALSGMRIREIIEFILTSYDFDGTQQLSIDEVTLALKSTSTGLCKVYGKRFPREELIEQLVSELFRSIGDAPVGESTVYRIGVLADHLSSHPDLCSWYNSFGEPSQSDIQRHDVLLQEVDYSKENPMPLSSGVSNEWGVSCKAVNEALATAPWRDVAAILTPSIYANCTMVKFAPEASSEITWVYGYQSEKSKNNLRYTSAKGHCIVYHVGRFGIVYSFDSHKQTLFSGHRDEIISLSVHPDGEMVATGDSAASPRLIVWSAVTKSVHFTERGFHKNGVIHTAFSADGKQLASVGLDLFHSVAVYLWQKNQLLYTSKVDKGKCLSCNFLSDVGCTLAIGGDSYLYLWSKGTEGYQRRRGNFSRHTKLQPITCIANIDIADSFVSGTVSGLLLLWTDRNCVRNIKGHQGSVNVLYSCPHGIVSGGKDKRIRLWTHRLEPGATFDMSHFGLNSSIRSVCLSMDGSSILFGTLASDIYEVSAVDGSDLRGGAIATGHSFGRLRSVGVHPDRLEFASVGDDRCLRIWDASTRSLLKVATFDCDARSVCYSPLGDVIAVGLGGDRAETSHPKDGAFVILNEEDLSVIHEAKDSNAPITVSAFSPEGETLAIGAADGVIFLYAVHDDYELVGRCVRHVASVRQLDFSVDGEWIRSNSADGELLFFNSDDASLQSNAAAMRDVRWVSGSCMYTWQTTSIHDNNFVNETVTTGCVPPNILMPEESDIVTTPLSKSSCFDYIVCGTNAGFVCLHPYPCLPRDSEYHRLLAHAGAVSETRFCHDSQIMVSCGLYDRCLIQWKCSVHKPFVEEGNVDEEGNEIPAAQEEPPQAEYIESEDFGLEMRGASDIGEDFMVKDCAQVAGILNNIEPDLPSTGDNFVPVAGSDTANAAGVTAEAMSVWLESSVEPNNPPPQHVTVPDVTMKLEYVHGYKCQDMRNNIRYTDKEQIVYVCSSVGVVMDRTTKAQNFFQGHSQAVSAFACSRNGKYVATGEIGHSPKICVWDSRTCATLRVLPDTQCKSVLCLAFSNSSDILAVVGLDGDHTISLYDWRSNVLLCRGFGGSRRIVDMCFSENDQQILSCGIKDVKLWNITTWSLTCRNQVIGDGGRAQPFLCCVYFCGSPTVGTVDGHFYVFDKHSLHHAVKAHTGGVHALSVSLAGDQMVSGGKDGLIKLWNDSLDCIKELSVDSILPVSQPSVSSRVRSVCFSKDGQFLLIGTRGAEIFEVRISNSSLVGSKPIMQAHGSRELWGLATHPIKDEFVTSGDDSTIRLWDTKSFSQAKCVRMDAPSRTIAYSPDGKLIAVGFGCGGKKLRGKSTAKDGSFVVLNSSDLKLVHGGQDSNEAIRFVKFSGDSKILAVGSEDSKIYLYNVRDHYSRRCTINCHRAPLMVADFSQDNSFLMSVDITKRICYSETTSGAHIPSPNALRDQKWGTWSSPVGWYVKGLWNIQPHGAEPFAVQRSWGGMLLACGNTAGRLYIVHNPCQDLSGFVGDGGHSGSISQVAWTAGDTGLVSVGMKDHAVMQWKLVYDTARESGDEGGLSCEDSELERDGGNESLTKDESASTVISGAQQQAWASNVSPPSHVEDDNHDLPKVEIEAEHVHGIRSGDCRQALKYNSDGNVVFFSSSLGVIYDRKDHTQHIYQGHKRLIISVDVGSDGKVVATGEKGFNPELHFWDAQTARKLSVISNIHRNGIISVSFSPSGGSIATLGQDTMHSIVILRSCSNNWSTDAYVASSVNVSTSKMLWVLHIDTTAEFPVICGGNRCMYFFSTVGKTLLRSKGTFGRKKRIQSVLCGVEVMMPVGNASDETVSTILTGTVSGHVYFWRNQRVDATLTAHDAPIFAICSLNHSSGAKFATGSKDGVVKIWSAYRQPLHSYNIQTFSPSPFGLSCHSLAVNSTSSKISLVLRSGEVFEVSLGTNSAMLLLEGHSHRELHGLCINPVNGDEYATVGDDGVVRVWSIALRRCVKRTSLEVAGRALSWSPDGNHIAVGIGGDPAMNTKDGAIMILSSSSLDIIHEDRKAKFTISDIKYSPSGTLLLVASRDGKLYIHDCQSDSSLQQYKLLNVIDMPSKECFVTHIDFSVDSSVLRVSTSTCDLLHFSLGAYPHTDGVQVIPLATTVRDEQWSTSNVPYGWMIKGVWNPPSDNIDISAIDTVITSPNGCKGLIASAYDNGEVKIFNYPCQNIGGKWLSVGGISSSAPSIKFALNGNYLLVLDASSRCVVQYRVIRR